MDKESALLRGFNFKAIEERYRDQTSPQARTADILKSFTPLADPYMALEDNLTQILPDTYGQVNYSGLIVGEPYESFEKDGVEYESRIVKCPFVEFRNEQAVNSIFLITLSIKGQTALSRENIAAGYISRFEITSNVDKAGIFFIVNEENGSDSGEFALDTNVPLDQAELLHEEFEKATLHKSKFMRNPEKALKELGIEARAQKLDKLDLPLDELGFEDETLKYLRNQNIELISDLVTLTEIHMREQMGFDDAIVNEVNERLNERGLGLLPEEDAKIDISELLSRENNLDIRLINNLQRLRDVVNLEDLLKMNEDEILSVPNIGAGSLMRLKEVLAERGIFLRKYRQ